MDKNIYENENGQMTLFEENQTAEQVDEFAEFKKVANEQFEKIRNQAMILGIRITSKMVLDKIAMAMNKPGKRSLNDYRRLVKEIEDFCKVGVAQKTKPEEETAQN